MGTASPSAVQDPTSYEGACVADLSAAQFAGCDRRLVLLHGWGLGPRPYGRTQAILADAGVAVVAPDLRRLGSHWSPERAVQAIVDEIDTTGWRDFAVVGHSLGGALAVLVAQTVPARGVTPDRGGRNRRPRRSHPWRMGAAVRELSERGFPHR